MSFPDLLPRMIECLSAQSDETSFDRLTLINPEGLAQRIKAEPELGIFAQRQGFTASSGLLYHPRLPEILVAPYDPYSRASWAAIAAKLAHHRAHRLDCDDERIATACLLGFADHGYHSPCKPESDSSRSAHSPRLIIERTQAMDEAVIMARAIGFVRDLINMPANQLHPQAMCDVAARIAKASQADLHIVSGEALLAEGYPLIHAVGRASMTPPALIEIRWGNVGPSLALIGKGVCFDSGGLDIKPAGAMQLMKKDMGGAAHALALAWMIMQARLPVRLHLLIPAVENAISGNAMRPLDVLESRDGTSIEVGDTDAEGRLILADAISRACEDDPDSILDFATLTGAARIALGTEIPALFSNDDDLAADLLAQAERHDDPLWRMPLAGRYLRHLQSENADLSSTGNDRYGGALIAALFLQHFVKSSCRWAHFDLMAWNLAASPGRPKGGEAMGLLACFAWVKALVEKPQNHASKPCLKTMNEARDHG
ncbi:MAG: leucyl aminopeptidase family protein [Pseudomonadota bacterium]